MVLSRTPNDCVVTALANYTGRTYDEVLTVLDAVRGPREGKGRGYTQDTWLFALGCLQDRTPVQVPLCTHSLVQLYNMETLTGHVVVIRDDATIIDGSLAQSKDYTLTSYMQAYPRYELGELWK